jgi:hypothetical protein
MLRIRLCLIAVARQFFGVRVPVPVVLLLCLAVLGSTWWKWTAGKDFLSSPDEQALEAVRQETARNVPAIPSRPQGPAGEPEPVSIPASPPPEPPLDPGDVVTAPGLNAYASEAKKGADHLIKLATRLEEIGATARALLAWERVIDFGKGDTLQTREALQAIRRLRAAAPAWNIDPEGALPLTLHLGASPPLVDKLKPLLPSLAGSIERASGGVIRVTPELVAGKKPAGTEPLAVILWLSGGPKEAPATEVLSVPIGSPEVSEKEVLGGVFQLVRGKLSKSPAYAAPPAEGSTEDPAGALMCNITRFCWQDFGRAMNVIPPAAMAVPAASTASSKPAAKPATKSAGKPLAPAKPAKRPVKRTAPREPRN